MTDIRDDELSAYLDGELPDERAAYVRRTLDSRPDLKARLEALAAADTGLRQAYDPLAEDPLPPALLDLIEKAPQTHPATAHPRPRQRSPSVWTRWAPIAAAAACVAVALLIVSNLPAEKPSDDLLIVGPVSPGTSLFEALENTPSGDQIGQYQVQFTFLSETNLCREVRSKTARGLACRRDHANWTVELITNTGPDENEATYTLAGTNAAAFDAAIDTEFPNGPLAETAEAHLIGRNWTESDE